MIRMNKIFLKRQFLKSHLFTVIGVMLCFYFSYHAVFGYRSVLALSLLENTIEEKVTIQDNLHLKRQSLEGRVLAMRSDSLDSDLLEERARVVLGYQRSDEITVLSN